MKAALIAAVSAAHAGTPAAAVADVAHVAITAKPSAWLTPTLDARLRYEFADIAGFDPSHALTLRVRPGLRTSAWHGFSAFAEGEFTAVGIDDYHGGAPGADPFDPNNSTIADPGNAELNQAYLQYTGFDTTVKLGRQRIIYDNAAFIGNVGWRQNEQTYDAVSIIHKFAHDLTLNYAWIDQVNRIYGYQAQGASKDTGSNIHLLNAAFTGIDGLKLGGYIYLMDFDAPALRGWDNDTFGVSAEAKVADIAVHAELAFQQEAGPANDAEAFYLHLTASKTFGSQVLLAGVEHLDAGFQTPLATLHAMNGFADATDLLRALGTHGGLTDSYLSHTVPLGWGVKWTNVAHLFGDNEVGTSIGIGFDSVLAKKFTDQLSTTAKLGYFDADDARYRDTTRASIELDYSF
jgi:hypothetical protein